MHRNVLPGQQQPYFLERGEGLRYLLGSFLTTIIGRRQDTGSLMEGVVLIGAKGSVVPLHRHHSSHETICVLDGSARLRLGDKKFALESGDYASVPPGTAHSFAFTSHRTGLLTWTLGDNGAAMYAALGPSTSCARSASRSQDMR
jgi:quercetin 2,3-dioxygenase